ncbi:MAG: DUF6474 family protein [Mycobacteriaceae bacterium]
MGLFRKRNKRMSRRALRKVHTKTLKAQAHAEKKFQEKAARKEAKKHKRGKPSPVAVGRVQAAAEASPATEVEKTPRQKLLNQVSTPRKIRNILGIVRVLSPVLAPLAYKGATAARTRIDMARARKIGVSVQQLGEFTGHGAALSARIAGLEQALDELLDSTSGDSESQAAAAKYRDSTRDRLTELATAVHAAERMPTARRKAAHRAVAADLDAIDGQLLSRLGVR